MLNECFLIRVNRKVNKDTTLKVENILYETEEKFKGMRLEVRYDPQWLKDNTPLINNLVTASLLYAYSKRLREIDEEVIYQAQNEISL
ncbi:MAG: Integrase catalytic region [Fusobacteriales bacterium]|jgi:hypothetical protein|nr:Integrase catalytic region [Fusobacteriales bacterium]